MCTSFLTLPGIFYPCIQDSDKAGNIEMSDTLLSPGNNCWSFNALIIKSTAEVCRFFCSLFAFLYKRSVEQSAGFKKRKPTKYIYLVYQSREFRVSDYHAQRCKLLQWNNREQMCLSWKPIIIVAVNWMFWHLSWLPVNHAWWWWAVFIYPKCYNMCMPALLHQLLIN